MIRAKKFSGSNLVNNNYLLSLFRNYRDNDLEAFYDIADKIISDQIVSNNQSYAKELKKALGNKRFTTNSLSIFPGTKTQINELLTIHESNIDSSKLILQENTRISLDKVIAEHRQRKKIESYGLTPSNKLLFWGPPGCGKTLSAFYLSYELNLPVAIVNLNTLISSYLGDTATNINCVFDYAKDNAVIMLFDEIDSIGKSRDDKNDVGELKRIVNSLLYSLDRFSNSHSVFIATSNHQYLLDDAIWRRFDDILMFDMPSLFEREEFLSYLLNGIKFEGSKKYLAKEIRNISFAQIEKIIVKSLKEMILTNKTSLSSKSILYEYREYVKSLKLAKEKLV